MATLGFRDRFFSPPVARALTSPSGILCLGAGVAVGIGVSALTGGVAAPFIFGALGGVLGYGGRIAAAVPRKDSGPTIDPFGVAEPWRHAVKDAQNARSRYRDAVRTFQAGPMRDALQTTSDRFDDAVAECWNVAKQGQVVSVARKRIDDREIQWELSQAAAQIPPGGTATEVQAQTIAALEAQAASAQRMDQVINGTYAQLQLLNARLDEAVTQAIELSVSSSTSDFQPVSATVDGVVDSLTALRQAMTTMDDPAAPAPQTDPPSGQIPGTAGA
ncbi:hypothetical protein [Aquihabitans sp. McL0605]|uniref:hypothetical protein n=1 Tax=Aquihabitans sp. McL0605 TaxID=3415671 RepID=UPI003CF26625